MKSFFKKVALLLAFAMVVTMLPAKAASAAETDGPQMYKTLRLYVGGDATEAYSESAYAKTWNKEGYDVVGGFTSSNEEVATVNDRGLVTAKSTGTATITAVFTSKTGGESVTKTCKVTVKRNAVEAGLGDGTAESLLNLVEGQKLQTKIYRSYVDAEGVVQKVWKGKDVVTDAVRFSSSNEKVFKVTKRGGYVTAVGVGTATLKVWPVQTEKAEYNEDGTVKEYKATAEPKEYPVVVSPALTAKQTTHIRFEVAMSSEEEAKKAAEETKKLITNPGAKVSDDQSIITVYQVVKNPDGSKNGEVEVIPQDTWTNKSTVVVAMFNELKEDTDYIIRYNGYEATVHTVIYVANEESLVIRPNWEKWNGDLTKVELEYFLYVDGVDISECAKYDGGKWRDQVVTTDVTPKPDYSKYSFDGKNNVYFYTQDESVVVSLKATFNDYYSISGNGVAKAISKEISVTPKDINANFVDIVDHCVTSETDRNKFNFGSKTFAIGELNKRLVVKATINDAINGEREILSIDDDHFTFVSANDDKLGVDKETGALFSSKDPSGGRINVHVYYNNVFVGSCYVDVISKRVPATFIASLSSDKYSYNADPVKEVDDKLTITFEVKDQHNALYTGNTYYNEKVRLSASFIGDNTKADYPGNYLAVVGNNTTTPDDDGRFKATVQVTDEDLVPKTATTVRLECTAEYLNNKQEVVRTMHYYLSFRIKNTEGEDKDKDGNLIQVASYKVEVKGSTEMELPVWKDKAWKNNIPRSFELNAYGYDREGFKIAKLPLVAVNANAINSSFTPNQYVLAIQNMDDLKNKRISENGTKIDVAYDDPTIDSASVTGVKITTVSGTSENNAIAKSTKGIYTATLYRANNTGKIGGSGLTRTVFTISDNQKVSMKWKKNSTKMPVNANDDNDKAIAALVDCFDFTYHTTTNGDNWVDYTIEKPGEGRITDITWVLRGNVLIVEEIVCELVFHGYTYTTIVPVNRTITVNAD